MKIAFLVLLAVFDCCEQSWLDSRIVGGSTAADGQFRYQVSLKFDGAHYCGGSIIKWDSILTAAHCIVGADSNRLTVMAGSNKLNDSVYHYNVRGTTPHISYDPEDFLNDIGIIHLLTSITPSPEVALIQLQTQFYDDIIPCVVSGWGFTNFGNKTQTNDLQYANLTTITFKDCRNRWKKVTGIDSRMVCTFTTEGQGICSGDSGGPLVSNGEQIGIVSFGRACGVGMPDVYTRVSDYDNWITNNS